jgi:inositol-phosphate transport system permease protein
LRLRHFKQIPAGRRDTLAGSLPQTAMPDLARAQLRRQRANFALFLGPALLLLACFFVAPVIVDVILAFTDMDRTLAVTTLTLDNFQRMLTHDSRLLAALGITAVFVISTLLIFNVTFALLLALTTTAVPKGMGAFFRAVWLLPRMSPSVVYALLWLWVVDPNERGLLNQILVHVLGFAPIDLRSNQPLLVIIIANGFIGASLGMIIFTSAIRSIPEHLFHAARVDGAGSLAIVRHIIFPALRWPISYMTIHQTLSLLVSFEYILLITAGGPFYDTTVFSLYAYRRAFENGQYAYGAALSLILIVIGVIAALGMWRLMDMQRLLQAPRIEVH